MMEDPSERSKKRIDDVIDGWHRGGLEPGQLNQLERLSEGAGRDVFLRPRQPSPPPFRDPRGRPRLVLGVSTWNRVQYLRRFVESFEATRSDLYHWTLIVADDGSTDGTWNYLGQLEPSDYRLVVIRNHSARIAGQTNSIFLAAQALGFDFAFKADDDIFFTDAGWDTLYFTAFRRESVDHLVYHNSEWKPPTHSHTKGILQSYVAADDSLGCFFTFTPWVLEKVGFFDEHNFKVRGHSHIDFTVRSCRAGFNSRSTLWDAGSSSDLVDMWSRDDYVDLTDWSSPEVQEVVAADERERRKSIIDDESRIRLGPEDARLDRQRVAVSVRNPEDQDIERLVASGWFYVPNGLNELFDTVFVINLVEDQRKFASTAAQMANAGIRFERFPGVFGGQEPYLSDWLQYESSGLAHPVERRLNRKLIESPGAWGYLLTMSALIEEAKKRRLGKILIFDDDIRLHENFNGVVVDVLEELPQDFTLIYLGATQRSWESIRPFSDHLYSPNESVDGSFAIGIDASVYDLLLSESRKFVWPFDAGPLRKVIRENQESTFVSSPNLVIPDVRHSHIRDARSDSEMSAVARWDLGAYRVREPATPRRLDSSELVSVLVPAVLDGRGLMDTLESLRSQTYGKMEILVAVSQGSEAELDAFLGARADPRVVVFSVDNSPDEAKVINYLLTEVKGTTLTLVSPGTVCSRQRIRAAKERLEVDDAADAVMGQLAICKWRPAGQDNSSHQLSKWVEFAGLPSHRQDVDLMTVDLADRLGGALVGDHSAFLEMCNRGKFLQPAASIVSLPGVSGVVTPTPTRGGKTQWDRVKIAIRDQRIKPYLRASPTIGPVSVARGNSWSGLADADPGI